MYIFILSILLVSFISLCFFKSKFWEKRYLVLFIGGAVALVITLTTNFFTRGKIETKIETVWSKPLALFYVNDSLVLDSSRIGVLNKDLGISDYYVKSKDSIPKTLTSFLFYDMSNNSGNRKIGFIDKKNNKFAYKYIKDIYIAPSESEDTAYYAKVRLKYNPKPNKWVANFSLPPIKTIRCFYVRPSDYKMIPDSLIKKLPF